MWRFHVVQEQADGVLLLRLNGRLGEAAAHLLREALVLPAGIAVVVDFSAVDYISGTALDVLDQAAHIAADSGRGFVVCGVEGSVRIALDLAGLLRRLHVEPTRERALTTAAGHSPPSATHGS